MSEIIAPNDYVLVKKSQDLLMRVIQGLFFLGESFTRRVTTYRLPFMKFARVCVPDFFDQLTVGARMATLQHEHHHVEQFKPWYGPLVIFLLQLLLPLPVLFSGRWFIERGAYLQDIRDGHVDLDTAVRVLWEQYGKPWPRSWMHRWFTKHLKETP